MRDSITQHHLCAVLNTEIGARPPRPARSPIRILDMGCGNGHLMAFLQRMLPQLRPGLAFEIYGFDVTDSRVQESGCFAETLAFLGQQFPAVDWRRRMFQIRSREEWPFPEGHFDYVVSNHVLEHVFDHDFAFAQMRRVLAPEGTAVHLFPLKCCIREGHLRLPFAHWISDADLLLGYLKACSRLGMGKCREHVAQGHSASLMDYCRKHADYLIYETNYLSLGEVYRLAKRNRLRSSFRYTEQFYANKLRQVFGRPPRHRYSAAPHAALKRPLFVLLMFVSSVTLVLEKSNTYTRNTLAPGAQ
ncbi:MAG: class I SAM-dependent methyltransferase [Candidatus Krumholzibacteriaceae bacterium]|jgi:SAM-dependent methyltransferase